MSTDKTKVVANVIPERGKSVSERTAQPAPKKVSTFKVIKYKLMLLIYKFRMRKEIKKRKYVLVKLHELKNLINQADSMFSSRQKKRTFFREFVKDGRVRENFIQSFIKMYDIPNFEVRKKK